MQSQRKIYYNTDDRDIWMTRDRVYHSNGNALAFTFRKRFVEQLEQCAKSQAEIVIIKPNDISSEVKIITDTN